MIDLTNLKPALGSRQERKRVGRGRASGTGKTSCRGHNGQGQRSGESKRFGFEGGQTPLFRRLPKIHNFDHVPKRTWLTINVGALNALAPDSEATPDTLAARGLVKKSTDSLRILGAGELTAPLKVKAHYVSSGARTKIEAAGGAVEIIAAAHLDARKTK